MDRFDEAEVTVEPNYLEPAINWVKDHGGVAKATDLVIAAMPEVPLDYREADDWVFFNRAREVIREMGGPPGTQAILAAALYHRRRGRNQVPNHEGG